MAGRASSLWQDADIPLRQIFLWPSNPRHGQVKTEGEAIEELCAKENVAAMARDLVKVGSSPIEKIALIPMPGAKSNPPTYYVVEGNRRVCAMKLMADPDKAPQKLRGLFEGLADKWQDPGPIPVTIFKDEKAARPWLERAHGGLQDGIGRRNWDADQKQRFTGVEKNKLAQRVLDYAEKGGIISEKDRSRKLTTVQRYFSNQIFRENIGIQGESDGELICTRPKSDVDLLLGQFVRDLVEGEEVSSRKNKVEITAYARKLAETPGLEGTRLRPGPMPKQAVEPRTTSKRKAKPKPVESPKNVDFDPEIAKELRKLGNKKLEHLYHSICAVDLDPHVVLICVGVWSFFESLTAVLGRPEKQPFNHFLQATKLTSLGLQRKKAYGEALDRLSECGNTTKHDEVAATFNGGQLHNDMVVLRDVILACIKAAGAPS